MLLVRQGLCSRGQSELRCALLQRGVPEEGLENSQDTVCGLQEEVSDTLVGSDLEALTVLAQHHYTNAELGSPSALHRAG